MCIQAITPTTPSFALASRNSRLIESLSVSTGFQTMLTGTSDDSPSARAISCDWLATWRRVCSPYSPWLPVTNQTSFVARSGTMDAELTGCPYL